MRLSWYCILALEVLNDQHPPELQSHLTLHVLLLCTVA